MSFRGGRAGGPPKQHLPFGLEYSDIHTLTKDTETPLIPLPVNGTLTSTEKTIGSRFMSFNSMVRDGPFFTGVEIVSITDNNKNNKENIEMDGNIHDGLKRYSDRYLKKRKIGPSIDDHPYSISFFPEELYRVMGLDAKKKKKLLRLTSGAKDLIGGLLEEEKGSLLERLKQSLDEDEKEDEKEQNEDQEENLDDEFEDEDDDDDYNAEKYFDDGEDFGDLDDFEDNEAAF